MTVPAETDHEEVIDLNTEAGDDTNTAPQDRGDDLPTYDAGGEELNLDALKAVAEDKGEPKEEDKADSRIPKPRFDEVNARMKAAEQEAAELRRQLAAAQQGQPKAQEQTQQANPAEQGIDLDAKEDEYLDALRQGNAAAAKAIRREINGELKRQAAEEAETKVAATLTQRDVATRLTNVANEAIGKYPFLNSDTEDKNEAAINDVVEWRDFYAAKGHPAHVALQLAVDKIGPLYAKGEPSDDDKPEPKVDLRGKEAIQRNALAAAAQPAALNGVGERASRARYDVTKMSEDEFAALPASEKKRLRGDA